MSREWREGERVGGRKGRRGKKGKREEGREGRNSYSPLLAMTQSGWVRATLGTSFHNHLH